jgi:hypothetical protein
VQAKYRVEAQVYQSDTWEPVWYTTNLTRAKRHAVSMMLQSGEIQATRVMDQITGQMVIGYEPATNE